MSTHGNTLLEEPLHSCSRRRVVAADGGGRERAPWTVQHGRAGGGVCRTGQVARGTPTVQAGCAVAAAAAAGAGTRRSWTIPAGTLQKEKKIAKFNSMPKALFSTLYSRLAACVCMQ